MAFCIGSGVNVLELDFGVWKGFGWMNEYPENGYGYKGGQQNPQREHSSGNDWIYRQPNQNTEDVPPGFQTGASGSNTWNAGGGAPMGGPQQPYGWDPYAQQNVQPGVPPGWTPPPQTGYAYMQGLGFVEERPDMKEKRSIKQTVTAVSLTAVLFSVLSGLLVLPMTFLFHLFTDQIYYDAQQGRTVATTQLMASIFNNTIYILCLLTCIVLLFLALRRPFSMKRLFQVPKAEPALLSVPIFLGVTVVSSGLIGLLEQFLSRFRLSPVTPDFTAPEGDTAAFLVFTLCMTVVPAFLEELLFRGVIMTSLRRYGDTVALLVSSLLFALVHGNFVQAVNAFLLAMVMGYFILRTGSLWTGILLHLLNNVLATLLPLVLAGFSQQTGELVNLIISAAFLLGGIIGVVVFAVRDKHAFRLINPDGALSVGARVKTALLSAGFLIAAIYYVVTIAINFEVLG